MIFSVLRIFEAIIVIWHLDLYLTSFWYRRESHIESINVLFSKYHRLTFFCWIFHSKVGKLINAYKKRHILRFQFVRSLFLSARFIYIWINLGISDIEIQKLVIYILYSKEHSLTSVGWIFPFKYWFDSERIPKNLILCSQNIWNLSCCLIDCIIFTLFWNIRGSKK